MKYRFILLTMLAAACAGVLTAAPQSDKQPIIAATGRFGDPTDIARKYADYFYGVIKEKTPEVLTLTKTKTGVDQTIKLNKKTKFELNGKATSLDKLALGDRIYVDVDANKKTGELTAKRVVDGVDFPTLPTDTP